MNEDILNHIYRISNKIPNVSKKGHMLIEPLLDDSLKEKLEIPETMKGCSLYSLSCMCVCVSVSFLPLLPRFGVPALPRQGD